MSRVVYIREKAPNQQHGGNKGVEDINTVLEKNMMKYPSCILCRDVGTYLIMQDLLPEIGAI